MSFQWNEAPLEELTEVNSPITYGVVKPGDVGDVKFIRGGDISSGRILHSQLRTITKEISDQYKRTLLRGGELLVSLVGQPGQVAVVPSALAGANIARQVGLVRLRSGVDADFISYFLQSPHGRKALGTYTGGSVQQVINLRDLRTVNVPIPPHSEQKRIVSIVDQAFEGIDRAIVNTQKNLINARELFESYLDAIFTRKGDGWIEEKLHSVVEPNCSLSYGIVQPGNEYEDGLPIVRPTDLTKKNINLDGLKRIDPSLADSYKRTKLSGGELLLCVRGSTGVVGIAVDELKGANVTRGIVPIRFERSVITQAFGYYLLISKMIQDQIREKTYGTALMQINIRDLKNILISFPDQEEQQILVEKLTQMENETQRLEAIYQQKLAALTELKQSILQKAFTGELTADTANQTTKKAEEAIAA